MTKITSGINKPGLVILKLILIPKTVIKFQPFGKFVLESNVPIKAVKRTIVIILRALVLLPFTI